MDPELSLKQTPVDKSLVRQLAAIRKRYTSLEEMAEALRPHPGFEELNRATISRWLKNPPQRAAVAVEILTSRRPSGRLRIAEMNALSVIPSSMLTWEEEEGKPYGLLRKQYGIEAEIEQTRFGGEAFDLLMKGKAEVALIPGDFVGQLRGNCRRLCSLSKLHVVGISTQRIESVFDLKGKRFGFPVGSAFGTRLMDVSRTWGVSLPPPVALKTPKDSVQAILAGQLQGVIGSEPSISQIRRAVERSLAVFLIPQGVLGWFEMHVAVNLAKARPAAVRAYLCGLEETTRHTNGRKSVAAFHTEIASRYNMDPWDVRNILNDTIFSMGEFDPAVLGLWEREVVELRKS